MPLVNKSSYSLAFSFDLPSQVSFGCDWPQNGVPTDRTLRGPERLAVATNNTMDGAVTVKADITRHGETPSIFASFAAFCVLVL